MVDIHKFDDLINSATNDGPKHLLLGNGFSRALKPDIFAYKALYDHAVHQDLIDSNIRRVFEALDTTDFEVVIRALDQSSAIMQFYVQNLKNRRRIPQRLKRSANTVREALARTISENHPERPFDINGHQYATCRRFLSRFDGKIYTLNYDLLLYWTFMQNKFDPPLDHDDGFRTPDRGDQEYVSWDIEKTATQRVHYLHGGIHIFDSGDELKKYTWINTQIPLVDQVRNALRRGLFPLTVAEGKSGDKLAKIMHSNYLSRAYRSISEVGGSLTIFGHSLDPNDEHIIRLIPKSRVKRVFIGIHGDPNAPGNQRLIARGRAMPEEREQSSRQNALVVKFFRSDSAPVWKSQ